ncbi:hypothetical protein EDD22DRAFT_850766 [Suillus occidentalis]|nr:hypothetical protein EDD22DRAFT_850766 [Suillus occidentalis]
MPTSYFGQQSILQHYLLVVGCARIASAWSRGLRVLDSFLLAPSAWPPFIYPLLSQTASASLTYNITLNSYSMHLNPPNVQPYKPPSDFVDQLADPSSVIHFDQSILNYEYNQIARFVIDEARVITSKTALTLRRINI